MPEVNAPGSPLSWVNRLEKQLHQRQAEMQRHDDYYTGNHPLPFVTKAHNAKMRDEFRQLLEDCRSNFMGLVVDAVEERLRVEGFRLSAATDATADTRSWEIWQANQMDAESQAAFIEALVKGMAYLSVWGGDPYPVIAVEDPTQTLVAYRPGTNFRVRDAALKVWQDDWTGDHRANLYLPDGIHKFERKGDDTSGNPAGSVGGEDQRGWKEIEGSFVTNPYGVVPIVPIRNRPRLLCEGESEIATVEPIQDRINGGLFMRALAGYFGAHRQRWAVGLTIHEDDNGKPVEPFDIAVDRLVYDQNPETRFGDFAATELDGYIKATEQDVSHIAITTRTPRHYLLPEGQEPSGDSIRSAESGLVKKVERKQRPFGEGLEEAIRLARIFAGESDAPVDSEIVWSDPRTVTEAETTDATIKQFSAGLIPWEAAVQKLGYSQTEINRFRTQRMMDALLNPASGTPDEETEPETEPEA
jgi:hypothetical protein